MAGSTPRQRPPAGVDRHDTRASHMLRRGMRTRHLQEAEPPPPQASGTVSRARRRPLRPRGHSRSRRRTFEPSSAPPFALHTQRPVPDAPVARSAPRGDPARRARPGPRRPRPAPGAHLRRRAATASAGRAGRAGGRGWEGGVRRRGRWGERAAREACAAFGAGSPRGLRGRVLGSTGRPRCTWARPVQGRGALGQALIRGEQGGTGPTGEGRCTSLYVYRADR